MALHQELSNLSNSLRIGKSDPWLKSIGVIDLDESRTISFEFHRPLNDVDGIESQQYENLLMPTINFSVYFPESALDKPFCFCENISDGDHIFEAEVSRATELANERLKPLDQGSLLLVLSVLKNSVNSCKDRIWPSIPAPQWARAQTENKLYSRLKEDLFSCELSLALFSIALHSYRRETITAPLPFFNFKKSYDNHNIFDNLVLILDQLPELSLLLESSSHYQKEDSIQRNNVDHNVDNRDDEDNNDNREDNNNNTKMMNEKIEKLPSLSTLPLNQIALLSSLLLYSQIRFKTISSPLMMPTHQNKNNGLGDTQKDEKQTATTPTPPTSTSATFTPPSSKKTPWAEVQIIYTKPNWNFKHLSKKNGIIKEAYHGSSVENWYSICHNSLKNMSQTRHEKHGAAFGEGIYLSTDVSLSREFAKKKSERHLLHSSSYFRQFSSNSYNSKSPKSFLSSMSKSKDIEFPFEIVGRCNVIHKESYFVPRPPGGHAPSSTSSSSSSSSLNNDNGVDYLVVNDETHLNVESLLIFPTPKYCVLEPTQALDQLPQTTTVATTTAFSWLTYRVVISAFFMMFALCFFW